MRLDDRKAVGYANSIIAMLNAGIDDVSSYRPAIDAIFCHVFGHVTKNDQRALGKYNKVAPCSKGVREFPNEKRVVEHVVPITVIFNEIRALSAFDSSMIIEVVSRMYRVRVITSTEDDRLNKSGLQKTMPLGYYDPTHSMYKNIEARHLFVGIQEA
ncbi:hypothetical protein VIBRN418_12457 [Vibrio sp. N418]|uniref:hypothetical protein n=1 Tax=Vibrio sp. (strain N418) TaxID=701176 RepID=UPI00021BDC3C|nr:hypothetical protein [Vibrio sp. N418]EGU31030.1 hypothetical protein VIBRN418_12457 [Vibrio sp. N418]